MRGYLISYLLIHNYTDIKKSKNILNKPAIIAFNII